MATQDDGGILQRIIDSLQGFLSGIDRVVEYVFAWGSLLTTIAIVLVVVFVLRCLILQLMRLFGVLNPADYRYIPRLPWRTVIRPLLGVEAWLSDFAMGKKQSARWSGPLNTLSRMFHPGMVLLGRVRVFNLGWFMPVGIKTRRHLMIVAGTGSGKTTSVISMLALHRGNCFVIDPKGQITAALYRRTGMGGDGLLGKGGRVVTLDPNGIVQGIPSSCWNPFDELAEIEKREGAGAVPEVAKKMAEALILPDSGNQPIFSNASRQFVEALILHVYTTEDPENRTLMKVRELLGRGVEDVTSTGAGAPLTPLQRLIMLMDKNTSYAAIANGVAPVREALKRNNAGSFLSSAHTQLGWVDLPSIRDISDTEGKPSFSLFDLKESDVSLFLVAKTTDITVTYTGWFRLLTVMAMQAFERSQRVPAYPCMFVIDEMPSLGRIDALETAAPVMRSYGVQLVCITQDLELLADKYPNSWGSFLGNADAVLWMGTNNQMTLDHLQDTLGCQSLGQDQDRSIAYAEQIKRFLNPARGNLIVTLNGGRPLRLKTPHYFRELPVYLYDPDRNEGETLFRRFGRYMCGGSHNRSHIEARGRWREFKSFAAWIACVPLGFVCASFTVSALTGIGLMLFGSWKVPAFLILFANYFLLMPWFLAAAQGFAPTTTRWVKAVVLLLTLPAALSMLGMGMYWVWNGFPLDPPGGGSWEFDPTYEKDQFPFHRTYAILASGLGIVFGYLVACSYSTKELSESRLEREQRKAEKRRKRR